MGGGSDLQLLPPFPLDPIDPPDPLVSSKNNVFIERVVTFGPGRRSPVMVRLFQTALRETPNFEHVLAHVPHSGRAGFVLSKNTGAEHGQNT